MQAVLARHDGLLRAAIETHHGLVFKTMGDGFSPLLPTHRTRFRPPSLPNRQ
jgi:hypothetical protein